MTRDEIAKEFDQFFEFDTEDRSTVTSTSARLFAEHIAGKVIMAEREACAKVAEKTVCDTHMPTGIKIFGTRAAEAIRKRGEQ